MQLGPKESSLVYAIVTSDIVPGRMEEFLDACRWLKPQSLAEEGCLGYEYTAEVQSALGAQEPVDVNRVTLIETWESLEALASHGTQPHTQEFVRKVSEVRKRMVVRVTSPLPV